ncbi:EF-hand domain-containing protein [Sphingomonas aracearum]|uniref:EF-hand domain-containing protein n=1 Tax=Sphingomonas aracearum TaxID=2283317 RepID=A0A369VYS2_9SPHN|nr:EF-hand domain-containing protein [Sphingomonas aracearum]RDE06777.1 EF-hand domain-containing protein [Sphingomonas aracearum]
MNTLVLAAALAGGLLANAAVAQDAAPQGPRGGGIMMRADANGDGKISRQEYLAQVTQRFTRRDADKDGVLSGDELAGPMRGGEGDTARTGLNRAQQRSDTNGDGKISQAEDQAAATARFDRLDTNKDGAIDAAERSAMRMPPRQGSPAGQ